MIHDVAIFFAFLVLVTRIRAFGRAQSMITWSNQEYVAISFALVVSLTRIHAFGRDPPMVIWFDQDSQVDECFCHNEHQTIFATVHQFCQFLLQESYECCNFAKIQNTDGFLFMDCSKESKWMERLKNVRKLDISDSGGANLTSLRDEYNHFPNLREIDLGGNSDIALEAVLDLATLDQLTHISLRSISIGSFKMLKKLIIQMPNLESLDVSNCNLREVNLTELASITKLNKINLSGNNISTLTFSSVVLKHLRYFNVSHCHLNVIKWEGPKKLPPDVNLQTVDLSSNNLTQIPEFLVRSMTDIRVLNLTDNKLETTTCLFYHLWKLAFKSDPKPHFTLEADFNLSLIMKPSLENCSWNVCPFECDCDPHSRTIDCTGRELENVPEVGPSDVEILLLGNNKLSYNELGSFYSSTSWCRLKTLDVANNNLHDKEEETLDSRETCICPPTCYFPHLEKFVLANNSIGALSDNEWRVIKRVQNVDLSHNKITQNSFHPLDNKPRSFTQVSHLDLSFNKINSLSENETCLFPLLKHLNISNNQLTKFNLTDIGLLPLLMVVDVSGNEIESIIDIPGKGERGDPDPFLNYIPPLEGVYLHNNDLQGLDPTIFQSLEDISLRGNSWNCAKDDIVNMLLFLWRNPSAGVARSFRNLKCKSGDFANDFDFTEEILHDLEVQHLSRKLFTNESLPFLIFLICFIPFVGFLILFGMPVKKHMGHCLNGRNSRRCQENFSNRRYDLFLYFCKEDSDRVSIEVLDRLQRLGYSIVSPRDFIYGLSNTDQFVSALRNSRRMIVIISTEFFNDKRNISYLKDAIIEEKYNDMFQVAAFYFENVQTPRNTGSLINHFLECKTLQTHKGDMWVKNFKKFIGTSNNRRINGRTPSSSSFCISMSEDESESTNM